MGSVTNIFLFCYILGTLLLNSCHPLSPQLKSEPMGRRVDGLRLYSEGPNCWNGALLKSGLTHSVRFVPKGEYWFWMKSPYCRELEASEKPLRGDLGSLFGFGQNHYHSFVYIDDTWVFSKNSPDPKDEYKVQRFEEMFFSGYQDSAKKCWQEPKRNQNPNCEFRVVYHRCRPIEKNFFSENREISKWDQKLKILEEKVFSWTAGESELSMLDYEQTVAQLYKVLREIQSTEKLKQDKRKQFKLEALEFRVLGLILADIKIASMIPSLYPLVHYAYQSQDQKKNHVPMNKH